MDFASYQQVLRAVVYGGTFALEVHRVRSSGAALRAEDFAHAKKIASETVAGFEAGNADGGEGSHV